VNRCIAVPAFTL